MTLSGLLAGALLLPAAANAQSAPTNPATVIGRVTCGPAEETAAPNAVVGIEGMNLSGRTDANGAFLLGGVPTTQSFTLDVSTGGFAISRYNLSVQPGETLDIGSLDLAVCPQPGQAAQTVSPAILDQPSDQPLDNESLDGAS